MFIITFLFLLFLQDFKSELQIQIPSINEEASSVWRTINDYKFLESQGYQIVLPPDPIIDELIEKSKIGQFGNQDYPTIYALMETKYYKMEKYQKAYQKTFMKKEMIETLISKLRLESKTFDWTFSFHSSYRVVFTLYGTGGSYDVNNGIITLFTTEAGKFMGYDTPENTIIHEIVHMGIESSVIQTYNINHGNKEWLTDTIVLMLFRDNVEHYRIQNMGESSFKEKIKTRKDLNQLNKILSQ